MHETTDAAAIFAPLWRRKWMILLVGILVAAGSYEYYKAKKPSYSVTTTIYLGGGSEEQSLIGGSASKKTALNAANQTAIINSSLISEGVRKRLHGESGAIVASAQKGVVKAKSKEKSQFIAITAEAKSAGGAALLANRTAEAYIKREAAGVKRTLARAITLTRAQIRRIESTAATSSKSKGSAHTPTISAAATIQLAQLNSRVNQLESEMSTTGVQQIGRAGPRSAQLLGPAPKKNAIFGFVIGVVLASIAAYVLSRFDRRLRSLSDIEGIFHAPILAALPTVKRPVVHEDGKPRPSAALIEPLRRLHTTLQVREQTAPGLRSLLFLSPDGGDGKSTIIADLALVQRDAGKRVVVVEADFRRPVQSKLLDLSAAHGIGEVLAGQLPLEEAMQTVSSARVDPAPAVAGAGPGVATVVEARSAGSLSVLASGAAVANPPALIAAPAMAETLTTLAQEFDVLLIDAPSPLEVSDVIPLLALVGGIVLVARVGHTRDASARRLAELLERTSSTPVLGVVANHVRAADIAKFGFSPAPVARARRRK
jgi:Mrp family chromosome partitioning ATPase/capsular polysaccharide biosynthesis protein